MIKKASLPCLSLYWGLFIIVLGIANFISKNAQAEQQFNVANNGTITAVASKRELTRISFNANVSVVNAIAGELEYIVNDRDIYLRTNAEKPVNFFVKLEEGSTFKFILSVEDIPATQIFVKSNLQVDSANFISKPQTYHNESISPELKKRIAKIITVALHPKKYIGYDIVPQSKRLDSPKENLKMELIGTITGNMLKAEKIYVSNKSKVSQNINLSDFITKKHLAVYLAKTSLLPKEQCVLIRITEN